MQTDLLSLEVAKRPLDFVSGAAYCFWWTTAELIRRQLAGEDLELDDEVAAKLRDQISTDEITPAYICYYFDETLGEFPYLGLRAGGEAPGRARQREGGRVRVLGGGQAAGQRQQPGAVAVRGDDGRASGW